MVRNVSPKNQNELLEETWHRSPFSPLNRTRKRADGGKCCRALWNSFWGQVWKKGILWNNCSITDHGVQQIWVQVLLCHSAVWQAIYVQSQSLGTVSGKRAIITSRCGTQETYIKGLYVYRGMRKICPPSASIRVPPQEALMSLVKFPGY